MGDQTTKNGFTQFPNALLTNPDLSANGRLVALMLFYHAGSKSNECWPSQETVAKESGMGRKRVNEAVQELRQFGLRTYKKVRAKDRLPQMHYDVSGLRRPVHGSVKTTLTEAERECQNDTGVSVKMGQARVSKRHTNKNKETRATQQCSSLAALARSRTDDDVPKSLSFTDTYKKNVASLPASGFDLHTGNVSDALAKVPSRSGTGGAEGDDKSRRESTVVDAATEVAQPAHLQTFEEMVAQWESDNANAS